MYYEIRAVLNLSQVVEVPVEHVTWIPQLIPGPLVVDHDFWSMIMTQKWGISWVHPSKQVRWRCDYFEHQNFIQVIGDMNEVGKVDRLVDGLKFTVPVEDLKTSFCFLSNVLVWIYRFIVSYGGLGEEILTFTTQTQLPLRNQHQQTLVT